MFLARGGPVHDVADALFLARSVWEAGIRDVHRAEDHAEVGIDRPVSPVADFRNLRIQSAITRAPDDRPSFSSGLGSPAKGVDHSGDSTQSPLRLAVGQIVPTYNPPPYIRRGDDDDVRHGLRRTVARRTYPSESRDEKGEHASHRHAIWERRVRDAIMIRPPGATSGLRLDKHV